MQQEPVSVVTAIQFSSGHRSTVSIGLNIVALTFVIISTEHIHINGGGQNSIFPDLSSHVYEHVTARALTHVIEVLPESFHPPMCFLSTVSGQRVRDLLTTVMVTDANVLSFTVRVFL